jgi:hypothetical protein
MITAAMATMATVDTRPCYPCGLFVYIAGSLTDLGLGYPHPRESMGLLDEPLWRGALPPTIREMRRIRTTLAGSRSFTRRREPFFRGVVPPRRRSG